MTTPCPCQHPSFIRDIFLDYHFWRFYDQYPWPHDYQYDDYGRGGENREYNIEGEEGIVGREGCETDTKEGGGRMKVIIAGSRGLKPYQLVTAAVQQSCLNITEVVSGGAKGIDTYGEMWAVKNHVNIALFPADWDKHGRKAGPMRNRKMAEYADALIAIWDGKSRGTKNMIDTMESMGKPTYVYTVN